MFFGYFINLCAKIFLSKKTTTFMKKEFFKIKLQQTNKWMNELNSYKNKASIKWIHYILW